MSDKYKKTNTGIVQCAALNIKTKSDLWLNGLSSIIIFCRPEGLAVTIKNSAICSLRFIGSQNGFKNAGFADKLLICQLSKCILLNKSPGNNICVKKY